MTNASKSIVYHACRLVLRPLASIFLKCGLTWKEFADLSKSVFVDAASQEYGIKGRPTNVSRVSILTGISRKEVKRQRDLLLHDEPVVKGKTTDATRVLSGWFQDPDFLDPEGEPMLLHESGELPSFEALCDRYSGDIASQTMLKELLQTETIARTAGAELQVKRRFYQPTEHDDEKLTWGIALIADLAKTVNHDVFLSGYSKPRFSRKAESVRMLPSSIGEFQEFLDKHGQAFLEEVDTWLTNQEANDDAQQSEFIRLGVGMFAIEDRFSKEKVR